MAGTAQMLNITYFCACVMNGAQNAPQLTPSSDRLLRIMIILYEDCKAFGLLVHDNHFTGIHDIVEILRYIE
jgi:hypothetical protein